MKDLIYHNVPADKNFFAIAVPVTWLHKPIDGEGAIITCQDKDTNAKTKCQIMDIWTFEMDEFSRMNGFSYLVYQLPAAKMAFILRAKYPEIDQSNVVRFVLLKKL